MLGVDFITVKSASCLRVDMNKAMLSDVIPARMGRRMTCLSDMMGQ
jgi:hypothetical protein